MYTALPDGTYRIHCTDGSEFTCSLSLYTPYTDIIKDIVSLLENIQKKEEKKTLIDIITNDEMFSLRKKEGVLRQNKSRWMQHFHDTLTLVSDIDISHTNPIMRSSLEYFFQGNLYEAIVSLSDPLIEKEASQDEQTRIRTLTYYRYKAYLYLLLHETKKAAVYLEKIILLSPTSRTYEWYADVLTLYHEYERALTTYELGVTVSVLSLDIARLKSKKASIYTEQQRYTEAISSAEQAIQQYEQTAKESGASSESSLAHIIFLLATCLEKQNQIASAATSYQRSLTLFQMIVPSTPDSKQCIADTYLHIAQTLISLQHIPPAEQALTKALQITATLDHSTHTDYIRYQIAMHQAIIAKKRGNTPSEATHYESAFAIISQIARLSPAQYIPDMIQVLTLLSQLYQKQKREKDYEIVVLYGKRLTSFYAQKTKKNQTGVFLTVRRIVLDRYKQIRQSLPFLR